MSCVIQQGGVTIIETGPSYSSLDYGALEGLGEVLLSEAAYADPPRLILDMSQTTFVSSSFIELLVRAWKRIKQRQGVMVTSSCSKSRSHVRSDRTASASNGRISPSGTLTVRGGALPWTSSTVATSSGGPL